MGTQKLGTEVRREQIVTAALALIAEQGLKQLSVARVARRVGLVPSAIYRHYGSKNEVIDAILDHIRARLMHNVEAVRAESGNALEQLHQLLRLHIGLIRENRNLPRLILGEEVYVGHPERRQKVFAIITAYLKQVQAIVREGQKEGLIRRQLAPAVISVMFLGLIQPAAILWQLSEGEFDVTRQAEKAWKVFRSAIASPDA